MLLFSSERGKLAVDSQRHPGPMMLSSLAEVSRGARVDGVSLITIVGPGGYVAAIKAAQLGLKVSEPDIPLAHPYSHVLDCLHREAWRAWWNVFERRMYTVKGYAQQLAYLPPNKA